VIAAELFNSALEALARGLCPDHNPLVGKSLDIASGAVLVLSLTAVAIGLTVLLG
jgi:diacylglycerol kinase